VEVLHVPFGVTADAGAAARAVKAPRSNETPRTDFVIELKMRRESVRFVIPVLRLVDTARPI